MSQTAAAQLYPITIELSPRGPAIFTLTPNISGLPLDFPGAGNYFAFSGSLPLAIASQTLARPFLVDIVNFLVNLALANTGGGASGVPSPSAVTCSASLRTLANGVVATCNNLNLTQYNAASSPPFSVDSAYEFQGSLPMPQSIPIDLLSPFPTLELVVGVQLPLPVIGGTTAGTDNAAPVVIIPGAPEVTTGVQLIGNPTRGSVT